MKMETIQIIRKSVKCSRRLSERVTVIVLVLAAILNLSCSQPTIRETTKNADMRTIEIVFADGTSTIKVGVLGSPENFNNYTTTEFHLNKQLADRFKQKVLEGPNGEVVYVGELPWKYAYVFESASDLVTFKRRCKIFRFSYEEQPFYTVTYYEKNIIENLLKMQKGKLMAEYSSPIEQVYSLKNGQVLHYEEPWVPGKTYTIGTLYNSTQDVEKLEFFELWKERSEPIPKNP